jgi:hypothetical protein
MLVTVKVGADFLRGCVLPVIVHTFFLTHLYLTIRELTLGDMR